MNVSLTPQLDVFIRECAQSGDFNNASEVVREAVRLFKRTEEERRTKLTQLQQAITEGDEAVSHGESNAFNSAADLDAFLSDFKPLRLSAPAIKDLHTIANYTRSKWGVAQKKLYLDLIKQSFQTLSTTGNIGKKRNDLAAGLYYYTIKKHCVYFR